MKTTRLGLFLSGLMLICQVGCLNHGGPDYAQAWAQAPVPTDPSTVRAECQRVRVAIADEQGRANAVIAMQTNPMMVVAIQNKERQRISYLEDRASQLNCRAAFSSAPAPVQITPPAQDSHMNFDQCFSKCKSITNRDDNQCFDSCK